MEHELAKLLRGFAFFSPAQSGRKENDDGDEDEDEDEEIEYADEGED